VDARVHFGVDAPIVRLRWTFTTLPWIRSESGIVINNRIWNSDDPRDLTVGQLLPVLSNYVQDDRWVLPPGLRGQHVCHEEWLSTGEPWPNDLPPTRYNCAGVPLCCEPLTDPTCGGVEVGGEVGDVITYTDPTAGGVQLGGATGERVLFVDPTAGGVQLGGATGERVLFVDPTAGGVQLGGQVGEGQRYIDATAGGVEVGGEVGEGKRYIDAAAGGVEVGGAAGDELHQVDATAGGVEVGGAAGDELHQVDATAGGVEVGGAAGDVFDGGGTADTYIVDGTITMDRVTPGLDVWADGDFNYVLGRDPDGVWTLTVNDPFGFFQPDPIDGWDGSGCETFYNDDPFATPPDVEICAA